MCAIYLFFWNVFCWLFILNTHPWCFPNSFPPCTKEPKHCMRRLRRDWMMLSDLLSPFVHSWNGARCWYLRLFCVALPLQFNDNNGAQKKKKISLGGTKVFTWRCVSAKFVFTPFTPVFVMYRSQTPSPEMDRLRRAEWNISSTLRATLKEIILIRFHSGLISGFRNEIQRNIVLLPHCNLSLRLNMCARWQRRRHASGLCGCAVISRMGFSGMCLTDASSPPGKGGGGMSPKKKGFMGQCLEGDTRSAALQQGLKY